MPSTLRFTKSEEKDLFDKCIEINKVLISKEKPPIRESELAHFLLEESVKITKINTKGELYLDL